MGIEFERKYVLDGDVAELIRCITETFKPKIYVFQQHYVEKNVRIRSIRDVERQVPRNVEYKFTYKKKVDGYTREIECFISPDDFHSFASIAERSLSKLRYTFEYEDNVFEVDFFVTELPKETESLPDFTYLVMAECETAPDAHKPKLPQCLEDALLLEVDPDNDGDWKSYNLTDPEKARTLVSSLK